MSRCMKLVFFAVVMLVAGKVAAYELGGWNLHGTVSQGAFYSKKNNAIEDSSDITLDFREFGVNASTSLTENISIGGQMFGRVFGAIGKDKLFLDWASITYSPRDEVGIRMGKLKVHYGLYGSTRDVDSLRTQVLLPQGVYQESYRGALNAMWGAELFGTWHSVDFGAISYSVQWGKSDLNEETGEIHRLASAVNLSVEQVRNADSGALKLVWDSPSQAYKLSSTYSTTQFSVSGPADAFLGFPSTFSADIKKQFFWINSFQYTRGPFTFSTEVMDAVVDTEVAVNSVPIPMFSFITSMNAKYAHLDYRFSDHVTLGAGYSTLNFRQKTGVYVGNTNVKNKSNDAYLSLRYDISANLIAKVEQHFNKGTVGLFAKENPNGVHDEWSMTLFKFSFVF